jgi:hypothetical protein
MALESYPMYMALGDYSISLAAYVLGIAILCILISLLFPVDHLVAESRLCVLI